MQTWQEFCTFIVNYRLAQFRVCDGDRAVYTVTFLSPVKFTHR